MSWISGVVALPGISGAPTRSGARCRTTEGGPTFHGAFPGLHEAVLFGLSFHGKAKGRIGSGSLHATPADRPASFHLGIDH